MNKQEFEDFVVKQTPHLEAEDAAKNLIKTVDTYFTGIASDAHSKQPDTQDTIAAGSTGNGLGTMLTLSTNGSEVSLRYEFQPSSSKINVSFKGKLLRTYSFSNKQVINDTTARVFKISDVETDLDNFK